ncbi:hypothetical protein HK102_006096 [Quaeritorhiza haematococci]|nr:hypothetical protein HK102_006096 [Quaeritorhiza haematococci]
MARSKKKGSHKRSESSSSGGSEVSDVSNGNASSPARRSSSDSSQNLLGSNGSPTKLSPQRSTDKLSPRRGSGSPISSGAPAGAVSSGSTPTGNGAGGEGVVLLAQEASQKKWKNWWVRSLWTVVMVSGFLAFLFAGHIWIVLLVVAVQTQIYKEVISIAHVPSKEKKLPWFRAINWYFLASTNYFLYGESIIHYFKKSVLVDAFLSPLATHHRFISFLLYCFGFMLFVLNLKKGHYKFQFSQFGWTHMTLLLVVCQSHFVINNIFEGLFWFVLPISIVVVNDIMAYIFGFFFGRTPLIQLSPKKTWEGFLGAFFSTLIWAFAFSAFLIQFPYLTCPVRDFNTSSFSGLTCDPNPVFVSRPYALPPAIVALIRHIIHIEVWHVWIAPVQWHALMLAVFGSLIAPFGGFFASGIKRAFKIKDFGDSIPGHGGLTDRMDCQFLMGLFSYMYYQSFIGPGRQLTVGHLLHQAVTHLSQKDQVDLYNALESYLKGQGVIGLTQEPA